MNGKKAKSIRKVCGIKGSPSSPLKDFQNKPLVKKGYRQWDNAVLYISVPPFGWSTSKERLIYENMKDSYKNFKGI